MLPYIVNYRLYASAGFFSCLRFPFFVYWKHPSDCINRLAPDSVHFGIKSLKVITKNINGSISLLNENCEDIVCDALNNEDALVEHIVENVDGALESVLHENRNLFCRRDLSDFLFSVLKKIL